MLKLELPAFARNVIDIIDKHNPTELKIKEIYDLLVDQMPNIDLLKWPYGAHPLTEPKRQAREMCLKRAQHLVKNMGYEVRSNAKNPTKDVIYASSLVNLYLYRLDLSENEEILIARVVGFFTALRKDEEMQKALIKFGFSDNLEKLEKVNTEYKELLMRRTQSKSQRCHLKTNEIVAPIRQALKNMFKMIEVAEATNPDIDYAPLISSLNQTIIEFKNIISRREFHNKKKAKMRKMELLKNEFTTTKVDSEEPTVAPDPPIAEPLTLTISLNEKTIAEKESERKLDKQLKKKKTAAMSAKKLRMGRSDNDTQID